MSGEPTRSGALQRKWRTGYGTTKQDTARRSPDVAAKYKFKVSVKKTNKQKPTTIQQFVILYIILTEARETFETVTRYSQAARWLTSFNFGT